ncbi:MAG: hypothetical protein AAF125_11515 [Chloroflexota bacterium]
MKYTVRVSNHVNCSSSFDYHVDVRIFWDGGGDGRFYHINSEKLLFHNGGGYYERYPKYVMREIAKQLKDHLKNGELKVYEYNSYGARRYEDLRYHEPEALVRYIHESVWVDENMNVYHAPTSE